MNRLSLVGRVALLASLVALGVGVIVAASLIAVVSLHRAEKRAARAKDVTAATLRLQNIGVGLESSLSGYTLSRDRAFLVRFAEVRRSLPGSVRRLEKLLADDRQQLARARLAAAHLNAYVADYAEPLMGIARISPDVVRGAVAGSEDRRRSRQIRGVLGTILAVENQRSADRARHSSALARNAVIAGSIGLGLSAVLVLLFGAWVARAVAMPVRRTSEAAARVAAGDFEVRVEERGAGEVGALVTAFNSMTRALELGRRELLEQNERLRESEQHKRDLISMVSHEIRTPLASVFGFTSLLLERDFPPDEQRRYLEIVDQQARRLAALAGDFLDVQLLEGRGLTLDRVPFDLGQLVSEQTRLFFSDPAGHMLDLALPDAPVEVEADRDRIAQVIGNLLSNAIKYSPRGSTVDVSLEVRDGQVQFAVADRGMGIPADERERVFEKFYRGVDTAGTIGGTGLGLAVASEIVDSHGGRLELESEVGRGSTFTMMLRLAPSRVTA